ncbi:MAG TPA: DUF542 domain-containing protein [Herpetosiphonaceae bacterium]
MTINQHLPVSAAIDGADTLNEIVARYPQTLPALQGFGLDTCCGGGLLLRTTAEHHHLDPDQVLRVLQAIVEGDER